MRRLRSASRRLAVAAAIAALPALWGGAALADDPIATRKGLMKTVGFSAKSAAAMVKGEAPYDPLKAELAMRAINAAVTGVPNFFPADSKTGGDTEAAPKIWEDMKGFLRVADELKKQSAVAIEAAKQGPDAFKAAFAAAAKYCKECHQTYRIKKK